jgi:predicted dehydrogenase
MEVREMHISLEDEQRNTESFAQGTLGFDLPRHVVQIGAGPWGRDKWLFSVLEPLARWGAISLTVVDLAEKPCAEIEPLVKEGIVEYLPWGQWEESDSRMRWQYAFVTTSADAQAMVCHKLLQSAPVLRSIVMEKPGGRNSQEVDEVVSAANASGVSLAIADHYLLRGPIRMLLSKRDDLFRKIGAIEEVSGWILENRPGGPRSDSVVSDMLIHLLHPCRLLFPEAEMDIDQALLSRVHEAEEWQSDTYAQVRGRYVFPDGTSIAFHFECGKCLAKDVKSLRFKGRTGSLLLDLQSNSLVLLDKEQNEVKRKEWSKNWNYGKLILQTLFGG